MELAFTVLLLSCVCVSLARSPPAQTQVSAQLLAYQECGPEFADVVWQYSQVKVRLLGRSGVLCRLTKELGTCSSMKLAAVVPHDNTLPTQPNPTEQPTPTPPQEELRKVEHALHHFSQLEMELIS